MYVGERSQIPVTTTPANISLDSLSWKSSDTSILTVSNAGLITAKNIGLSTITVSNLAGTKSLSALVVVKAPGPDSLKLGIIAYYPFTGSAADSSGNGYNGTVFNATLTTDRFGNVNSAYAFDGSSSYITVNDAQALRLSGTDFTLNYWVYLNQYIDVSGSAILSKNNGAYQNGWNCSIVGTGDQDGAAVGNVFYNVSGGSDPFATSTTKIDTAKWYMVTIAYQVSKSQVSIYVNGIFDSTISNIPTPNSNTNAKLHLGNNSYGDISPSALPYFLDGKLDDIRIYNRKLKASEITELYLLPNADL